MKRNEEANSSLFLYKIMAEGERIGFQHMDGNFLFHKKKI